MPEPRESRTSQSQFRRAGGGREALAPPTEGMIHVYYTPRRQTGIGCVTSRPAAEPACRCWACRMGAVVDHSKLPIRE